MRRQQISSQATDRQLAFRRHKTVEKHAGRRCCSDSRAERFDMAESLNRDIVSLAGEAARRAHPHHHPLSDVLLGLEAEFRRGVSPEEAAELALLRATVHQRRATPIPEFADRRLHCDECPSRQCPHAIMARRREAA